MLSLTFFSLSLTGKYFSLDFVTGGVVLIKNKNKYFSIPLFVIS